MNGKHQRLVYGDDVNMLRESLQTVRENTEIFIKASKDIGLETNSDNIKYMITSRQQNIVQLRISYLIENLWFENVEKLNLEKIKFKIYTSFHDV